MFLLQLSDMSQKIAIQTWRLVQPKDSDRNSNVRNHSNVKSSGQHRMSLVEKAQNKKTRDFTQINLKKLTKKDYCKADELKRGLLHKITNFKNEEDFIKLVIDKKEQDDELDRDLDNFISEYFGDSNTTKKYKSRNVLRREKAAKDRELFSIDRLPGCSQQK